MNRNTMLPFSVEKATPVAATANASVPSATTKTPAPPPTPVVAAEEVSEAAEADKTAPPSEKIWAAIRSFGAWKATVLGSGPPALFTVSGNVADGSLGGRQSSDGAARIVELEEKEDHVYLPIIPETTADGQSKNLKGETIVGAVCDIRHSPNRILRLAFE
ncbi:hypothetical protein HPB52_020819 [Rhipicephalus sanguineus]|uniref:Uncharacterized protein n=1 Tax=Rhipicephalus sanguineus TaxID=34632 RepID=A0A9D4T7Y8_RHISA|nr:hypothetical protein HPB52_020819 [Rhipicephalus sanguineus]